MDKTNNTPQEVWDAIQNSKNVLMALHVRGDLDAGGSCVAMANVLKKMGKKVRVVSADEFTYMKNIFDTSIIEKVDPADVVLQDFDTFIGLDSGVVGRYSADENFSIPKAIKTISIDHHVTNDYWADINYVINENATSIILFDLFKIWGVEITKELAQPLLGGIVGDTGFFQYLGVGPKDFRITAELLDAGADLYKTVWNLTMNESLQMFLLKSRVFANIKVKGKYAYSSITLKEKEEIGMSPEAGHPTETDFIKSLEGVDFVFTIRELSNGKFKCSFRSRAQEFDTTLLSVPLGGGGHKAASAAPVEQAKTLGEAIEVVEDKIKEVLRY